MLGFRLLRFWAWAFGSGHCVQGVSDCMGSVPYRIQQGGKGFRACGFGLRAGITTYNKTLNPRPYTLGPKP